MFSVHKLIGHQKFTRFYLENQMQGHISFIEYTKSPKRRQINLKPPNSGVREENFKCTKI